MNIINENIKRIGNLRNSQVAFHLALLSFISFILFSTLRYMDINSKKEQFTASFISYEEYMNFSSHLYNVSMHLIIVLFIASLCFMISSFFEKCKRN